MAELLQPGVVMETSPPRFCMLSTPHWIRNAPASGFPRLMRYEHVWTVSGIELCTRCGNGRDAVLSGSTCRIPTAEPVVTDAQAFDRGLSESAFDRMDRLSKRR